MEASFGIKAFSKSVYRIRRCPVPPLCLVPPCEIGGISVFEKFFNKKFYVKNYNIELTLSKIFLFLFVFPIEIRWNNNKTTLQSHFWYKSCKIKKKFGKFLKIKNHRCLVPPHEFGQVSVFWGGTRQRRKR